MTSEPTDDELHAAASVLRRAADLSAARGFPPQVLTEFGAGWDEKYLFMRLDWIRTSANAMGYAVGEQGHDGE